jgi:hypothetical protein
MIDPIACLLTVPSAVACFDAVNLLKRPYKSCQLTQMFSQKSLLAALSLLLAASGIPVMATTNAGIDTPSGVTSLPIAVEGMVGITLLDSNPPNGPVHVGIGTTVPASALHVYSTASAGGITVDGNSNPAITLNGSGSPRGYVGIAESPGAFSSGAAAGDIVVRAQNSNLLFNTNGGGATAMYISTSGNVGIGTINPIGNLDVENGQNTAKICLDGSCIQSWPSVPQMVSSTAGGLGSIATTALCPSGTHVISGGGSCTCPPGYAGCTDLRYLINSMPDMTNNGWIATCGDFATTSPGALGDVAVIAYALCQ